MTNRLDCIDKAAIRHGRFDKVFYVGLPDFDCRKALLKMEVGKLPHEKRIDYDSLAMMSECLAAVDLTYAVKEAARLTFCACLETRRSNLVVKESLLRKTIEATHHSVSDVEMRNYERIWDEYVNKNKNRRQTLGYLAQKTMSL
jgi:transitional endoplasmic reticulum ATPase